jgi:hypothetical protein
MADFARVRFGRLDPEPPGELGPLELPALATVAGLQDYLRVPLIDFVTYVSEALLTRL